MGEGAPLTDAQRLYLCRRAERKVARALRLALYRLDDVPYERARIKLGLSVHEFSMVKALLHHAKSRALNSAEPKSLAQALEEWADERVSLVVRIGRSLTAGRSRAEAQAMVRLDRQEFDECWGWWQDLLADQGDDDR